MIGSRRDALGTLLHDLHETRVGIAALALDDLGPDAVAGKATRHEHHVATLAKPPHTLAPVGERVDAQLDLLAALGSFGQGLAGLARGNVLVEAVGGELGARLQGRALCQWYADAGSPVPATGTSNSSKAFWAWRRFSA